MIVCTSLLLAAWLLPAADPAPPLKIYLLAGQSNMAGYSTVRWLEENAPELRPPRDDVWCFWRGECRPLQPGAGINEEHFGLELSFGHVVGNALENPLLLCKFGMGGTSLYRDWRSPSAVRRRGGAVGPLYVDMMRSFHRILRAPERWIPGLAERPFEIAGFIWFQGEDDSCLRTEGGVGLWEEYEEGLRELIGDVRSQVGVPDLPVCVVQISRFDAWEESCEGGDVVRNAQERIAAGDERIVLVVTSDLESSHHYGPGDQKVIGERVGRALLPLTRVTRLTDSEAVAEARRRVDEMVGHPYRGLYVMLAALTLAHLGGVAWLVVRRRRRLRTGSPRVGWIALIAVAWPAGALVPLGVAISRKIGSPGRGRDAL